MTGWSELKTARLYTKPRLDWVTLSGWGKMQVVPASRFHPNPSSLLPPAALAQACAIARAPHALLPLPFTITLQDGLNVAARVDRLIGDTGYALTIGGVKLEIFGGKAAQTRDFQLTATGVVCQQYPNAILEKLQILARELIPATTRLAASRLDACVDFVPPQPRTVERWQERRVTRTKPTLYGEPLETWQEGSRNTGSVWRMYNRSIAYDQQSDAGLWGETVEREAYREHGPVQVWRMEAEEHTENLEALGMREVVGKIDEGALAKRILSGWLRQDAHGQTRLWVADASEKVKLLRQRDVDADWQKLVLSATEGDSERKRPEPRLPSPEHALADILAKIRRLMAIAVQHPRRHTCRNPDCAASLEDCETILTTRESACCSRCNHEPPSDRDARRLTLQMINEEAEHYIFRPELLDVEAANVAAQLKALSKGTPY